ncbi:MAG: radical SAM family heme chaperone HemW [Paludibacteraceae bacterium]|nr:radical SAM family heme chaperone HemW [Paludibacteraceae bacterium]
MSRCSYCDFFSTTCLDKRHEYVEAVINEWHERQDYLQGEAIQTIYLGGGTPSVLEIEDLKKLLSALPVSTAQEITMEANPGDLTEDKLKAIRAMGVNRLSIGIQCFDDELLKRIGRRHNSQQAIEAVQMAQRVGFDNISIDLIYGLPEQTLEHWKKQVATALRLGVQHISTYCLMIEPSTTLGRQFDAGIIKEVDENSENSMYDYICKATKAKGYYHYEISNFALSNYESKHNSSYWNGTPYIGLGAGAHSYNGHSRQWNISDLKQYLSTRPFEVEKLSETDLYNEKIMLSLRTAKGLQADVVEEQKIRPWIERGFIEKKDNAYVATQKGQHILNTIIEDLMI